MLRGYAKSMSVQFWLARFARIRSTIPAALDILVRILRAKTAVMDTQETWGGGIGGISWFTISWAALPGRHGSRTTGSVHG